jgi:ferrochelatase
MEVMYDLDHEAAELCRDLGLNFVRAQTPGTHPAVIALLADLIEQRQSATDLPFCPSDCCHAPKRGA